MEGSPARRFDPRILVGAGLLLYVSWVAGTAIGALGGQALGDPKTLGLDAAFPALFLALLLPQLRNRRTILAAVLGGAIALALIPLAPAGSRSSHERRVSDRGKPKVTDAWIVVLAVGTTTVAIKSLGPVLLGGRSLPSAVAGVVELLAPRCWWPWW